MNKGRFLHQEKLKDHSDIGVYGIFSTTKVEWKYYVISYRNGVNNKVELTPEICGFTTDSSIDGVARNGKEFKTVEEAKEFIQTYKVKWESGSNNTTQEVRAKKLDDILEGGK